MTFSLLVLTPRSASPAFACGGPAAASLLRRHACPGVRARRPIADGLTSTYDITPTRVDPSYEQRDRTGAEEAPGRFPLASTASSGAGKVLISCAERTTPNSGGRWCRETSLWPWTSVCGRLSDKGFLTAAVSRTERMRAHHLIGLTRLAEGDRVGAMGHFAKIDRAGNRLFGNGAPNPFISRAPLFLERMRENPTWPPWIPLKEGDREGSVSPQGADPAAGAD